MFGEILSLIFRLLPFIIVIGVIYFIYSRFFKQRWEKFGKDLSLNLVNMKNIAFPEHIRKSRLFENKQIKLNAYLEGPRNGFNWDVYTYVLTKLGHKQYGYLLITVRKNNWKFPRSNVMKKKISNLNNMFNQALTHLDSLAKKDEVSSPKGFSFFCENKKDSDFINKINSLLEDKNNYFGYNNIHFNEDSVFFVFDITKTRKVPFLVNKIEDFVKKL